ncbi:hypothetical protein AB0G74_12715 [Streptomyces sp. NPDC020875]|uniref:hypothetical protein n=1 Tax=Streptomyces sp. NPDC020875 TaxID=3154898 RepID=UPI0033F82480
MSDAFDLNAWVNEARREPFRFTLADTEFTLTPAGELDKGILKAVNLDAPSAPDIENLLRAGLGDQWPHFDSLPAPLAALGELFRRWQRHEGAALGESPASADS